MLLECCGDGRFTGCGQAGEPDCAALLLAESVALIAGEARVPGDVAGGVSVYVVERIEWLSLGLVRRHSKNLRCHFEGVFLKNVGKTRNIN